MTLRRTPTICEDPATVDAIIWHDTAEGKAWKSHQKYLRRMFRWWMLLGGLSVGAAVITALFK
jgi:hypothetical protein